MRGYLGKVKRLAKTVVFMALMLSLFLPGPVEAQGLAVSGNFYRQHFELSPGETSSGDDVYVVVEPPSLLRQVSNTVSNWWGGTATVVLREA